MHSCQCNNFFHVQYLDESVLLNPQFLHRKSFIIFPVRDGNRYLNYINFYYGWLDKTSACEKFRLHQQQCPQCGEILNDTIYSTDMIILKTTNTFSCFTSLVHPIMVLTQQSWTHQVTEHVITKKTKKNSKACGVWGANLRVIGY